MLGSAFLTNGMMLVTSSRTARLMKRRNHGEEHACRSIASAEGQTGERTSPCSSCPGTESRRGTKTEVSQRHRYVHSYPYYVKKKRGPLIRLSVWWPTWFTNVIAVNENTMQVSRNNFVSVSRVSSLITFPFDLRVASDKDSEQSSSSCR